MMAFTPRHAKPDAKPTLGNAERRAMANLIASRLQEVIVDWTSGHGKFLAGKRVFCVITREGDLAITLSSKRMEELVGNGEAKLLTFGKRVVPGRIVIDGRAHPTWAFTLLQEARNYAESTVRKKT